MNERVACTIKDALAVVEVLHDALGPHGNTVLALVLAVRVAESDDGLGGQGSGEGRQY